MRNMSDEEDDDEDGKSLGRDTVKQYHFGGGFVPAGAEDGPEGSIPHAITRIPLRRRVLTSLTTAPGEERRKTKKEVMEEIIAKSKFYKAEKRREKGPFRRVSYALPAIGADGVSGGTSGER